MSTRSGHPAGRRSLPVPPDAGRRDDAFEDDRAAGRAVPGGKVMSAAPVVTGAVPVAAGTAGTGSLRRAAIGSSPGSEKGRRMRRQLLSAAREVFERDGYLNARVTDIAAAAGASHGSFYTYFESKTEVFRALVAEEMNGLYRMLGTGGSPGPVRDEPNRQDVEAVVDGIEHANRRFIEMYQRNHDLLGLFEQVTSFDDEVRALRMQVRQRMVDRVTASIRRMQDDGLVSTALDAHYSSSILVSMANSIVHHWLVVGEEFDGELLVRTLTQLWAGALGLPVAADRWAAAPGR